MSKQVTIWWSPGEDENDLHGFVTKKDRDDYDAGKVGPFLRIVRNHHELGPVPFEARMIRIMYGRHKKGTTS